MFPGCHLEPSLVEENNGGQRTAVAGHAQRRLELSHHPPYRPH
jgi:hypothetical protein